MRLIRRFFLFVIILFIGFYFLEKNELVPNHIVDKMSEIFPEEKVSQEIMKDEEAEEASEFIEDDLTMWMGKSSDELIDELGEPLRRDLSAYGYTWWVYTNETTDYIQFGIDNERVQTIYMTNVHENEASVWGGQTYEQMDDQYLFNRKVSYRNGLSIYNFMLTTDDLRQRPLVKLNDDVFAQFYFDRFLNELSAVRLLTAEVLLNHTPYEIEYRGDLPAQPTLSDQDWEEIERGSEHQIFLITNIIRAKHQKTQLIWEEKIREVAYFHSKDMFEQNYFSHDSIDGRSLKDRLAAKDILYRMAGENIAAKYPDGPAAVEGWLNSEGHREALLQEDFTHLGVGVYRLYFTQNFITNY